jgi:hypothetical protein
LKGAFFKTEKFLRQKNQRHQETGFTSTQKLQNRHKLKMSNFLEVTLNVVTGQQKNLVN